MTMFMLLHHISDNEMLFGVCRLLDDNQELFVPELQETIKPHPHFMLFATQNPPGEANVTTHFACQGLVVAGQSTRCTKLHLAHVSLCHSLVRHAILEVLAEHYICI